MERIQKKDMKNSKDQAYVIRMPGKMHNDLKLIAAILHTNMQDIVLTAIEDRLNYYKETNKRAALILEEEQHNN